MVGSIIIPDMVRADESGTLWEFVKGTPHYEAPREGYADVLGCEIAEGDILQTASFVGLDIGWGFFLISANDVRAVHPWVTEQEDDDGLD